MVVPSNFNVRHRVLDAKRLVQVASLRLVSLFETGGTEIGEIRLIFNKTLKSIPRGRITLLQDPVGPSPGGRFTPTTATVSGKVLTLTFVSISTITMTRVLINNLCATDGTTFTGVIPATMVVVEET